MTRHDGEISNVRDKAAASTVPENKKAPCNICGRGWPYHHDACAYKHTAIERDRYREALIEVHEFQCGCALLDPAECVCSPTVVFEALRGE